MGEYLPKLIGVPLRDVQPLHVSQPEGVSFTLDGYLLSWQNWRLRLGFNYREGPVIHQVAFDDPFTGEKRDVAYRMSFAEMVVPYRDAGYDHYRRTAFDIGEWGLGYMTTSLELGCDCLGEIVYADAVVPDSAGEPQVIKQAICLHEEDNAVLWKHVDPETGAHLYRTTSVFLEKLGLDSVDQLPPLSPFLPEDVESLDPDRRPAMGGQDVG